MPRGYQVDLTVLPEDSWTTLIDAVLLDDSPTSATSANMAVDGMRGAWVLLNIDSTLTPTDVRFVPQFSEDGGTTYYDYLEGVWASMYFEDADTASGITRAFYLPFAGVDDWRMYVVATGTSSSAKFTITVKARAYR